MNYVIWDVETDSADTNYATIIEIGALLLDENFREKERFSARCRIPQDRVPSATALCVNRSSIDLLTNKISVIIRCLIKLKLNLRNGLLQPS